MYENGSILILGELHVNVYCNIEKCVKEYGYGRFVFESFSIEKSVDNWFACVSV